MTLKQALVVKIPIFFQDLKKNLCLITFSEGSFCPPEQIHP